jgi:hypothetical protein
MVKRRGVLRHSYRLRRFYKGEAAVETLLAVAIVVIAAAVVWQALVFFGIARTVERLSRRFEAVLADAEQKLPHLLAEAEEIVTDARGKFEAASTNIVEITELAKHQVACADELVTDFTDKLRLQAVRLEETWSSVVQGVEKTTSRMQKTVIGPVHDLTALMRGIRTGVDFFFKRRPSPTAKAYQDEEMFI